LGPIIVPRWSYPQPAPSWRRLREVDGAGVDTDAAAVLAEAPAAAAAQACSRRRRRPPDARRRRSVVHSISSSLFVPAADIQTTTILSTASGRACCPDRACFVGSRHPDDDDLWSTASDPACVPSRHPGRAFSRPKRAGDPTTAGHTGDSEANPLPRGVQLRLAWPDADSGLAWPAARGRAWPDGHSGCAWSAINRAVAGGTARGAVPRRTSTRGRVWPGVNLGVPGRTPRRARAWSNAALGPCLVERRLGAVPGRTPPWGRAWSNAALGPCLVERRLGAVPG
jgi:hypothetical protein